jgi:hypothetical protein
MDHQPKPDDALRALAATWRAAQRRADELPVGTLAWAAAVEAAEAARRRVEAVARQQAVARS